jgi:hypothetical protein
MPTALARSPAGSTANWDAQGTTFSQDAGVLLWKSIETTNETLLTSMLVDSNCPVNYNTPPGTNRMYNYTGFIIQQTSLVAVVNYDFTNGFKFK